MKKKINGEHTHIHTCVYVCVCAGVCLRERECVCRIYTERVYVAYVCEKERERERGREGEREKDGEREREYILI